MNKELLKLYLVTQQYGDEERFLKTIKEACANGVTLVQLREKDLGSGDYYRLGLKVKAITDSFNIPLIIDDRVDICLALDAAGLHIGDDELPVNLARKLIGPDRILGVSTKTVKRSLEAKAQGADYFGVGSIYPSPTKKSSPITPIETIKDIVNQVGLPVVAIGGVTEENLGILNDTGIAGISVVSEIMLAEDVPTKVKNLRRKVDALVKGGE